MRKFLTMTALSLFLAAPSVANAQGVPTIDSQNIMQSIKQVQNMIADLGLQNDQLQQLLAQVKVLEDQLKKAQELYSSLTGMRDIVSSVMDGDINGLLNGSLGDVVGSFKGVMNGDFSGLTGTKSVNMRKTMDEVLARSGFSQEKVEQLNSSEIPAAKRIAATASSGAVVAAVGEQSHKASGESLQRVEKLVGMIPDMSDMKASIDLNTRLTAEIAISLAKMIELQSVMAVNDGMSAAAIAASMAEDRAFMSFGE